MSVLSSLPDRPLRESEVVSLNRSEEVELAVATETTGPTAGVVVATADWVKGLAFDGTWEDGFAGNWTVVETISLDDADRYEGLQQCEDAVRLFLGEIEPIPAEADTDEDGVAESEAGDAVDVDADPDEQSAAEPDE